MALCFDYCNRDLRQCQYQHRVRCISVAKVESFAQSQKDIAVFFKLDRVPCSLPQTVSPCNFRAFQFLAFALIMSMNPTVLTSGSKIIIVSCDIPTDSIVGLQDWALTGVLAYSIARVSAVIRMDMRTTSHKADATGFVYMKKVENIMRFLPIAGPRSVLMRILKQQELRIKRRNLSSAQ